MCFCEPEHFVQVDEYAASHIGQASHAPLEPIRPCSDGLAAEVFSATIQAAIQTSEIAVDPSYVASPFGAPVHREPLFDSPGAPAGPMV